jgi:intracellular sulfur oxidation DsrE/DsrF family protein
VTKSVLAVLLFALSTPLLNANAAADDDGDKSYDQSCPVAWFSQPYYKADGTLVDDPALLGRSMDEEFGSGARAITHCLRHRTHAKVLIAINGAHPSNKNGVTELNKARFLSNIEYLRENYEHVHGMKIGKDVDIVVVASNSGALLMTTEHPAWMRDAGPGDPPCSAKPVPGKTCTNPFRAKVERGLQLGIRFYVCQMASRTLGINMSNKIPGVGFVPGGHIAVADFPLDGYALIDL